MGVNVTRVVKFIRKGDKGSDAVRYWLIPSVSSVSMADVEGGDGKPTPSSVSCRLVKQVGDDTPTTITNAASAGLTMSYAFKRNDNILTQITTFSGGLIAVPTNTAYRAIDFYLYRGAQLIDTATIAIVCDGEPGEPGKDGVSYAVILSPNSIAVTAAGLVVCESDDITATAYKNVGGVTSEAKDGTMRIFYTKADGTTSNVAATGVKANAAAIYTAVWFEYIVNSKTVASAALVINREGQTGAQGDRGPVLRGPQAWSDCATRYNFQCGAKGEAYKDVVLYGNNYYSCVKSHTKTTGNYPGSTADKLNSYWQLGDKIELVATKILLASYALVKNLGVECIDMRDAAGNILFQAKDGNVTCKTGVFDGITVRNAEIESGRIAGFKVSGTGLTNDPFTNDAYIVFRNDERKAFAGIGGNVLPASSGARAVARFENHDPGDFFGLGTNYGALISARGLRDNIAIQMDGGTISGMALRNTIIGTAITAKTLTRYDYNVITINTDACVLTLPTMQLYDDGHVIRIKRLGSGALKLQLGYCYTYNSDGTTGRYSKPCLIYDQNNTLTGTNTLEFISVCDAMELVWCRDIIRTIGNTTYYGAWVQYKLPRDW